MNSEEEESSLATSTPSKSTDGEISPFKSYIQHPPVTSTAADLEEHSAPNGNHVDALSGPHIGAPGHSPSFASLADTGIIEDHHTSKPSQTFEGFETPLVSHSQEHYVTPKVTRPVGLTFAQPAAPEEPQTPHGKRDEVPDGTGAQVAPETINPAVQERHAPPEIMTSHMANLVEQPRGVDSPTKGQSLSDPQVFPRKIPGHELLSGFLGRSPHTPDGSEGVHALAVPVGETKPSAGPSVEALPAQEASPREPSVPEEESVESVPPQVRRAPKSEENDSDASLLGNLESESPIAHPLQISAPEGVDTTPENAPGAADVRTAENLAKLKGEKPEDVTTEPVGADEDISILEHVDSRGKGETFPFRNAQPYRHVSTSKPAAPPNAVPVLGRRTTTVTKKWRGPNDDEFKTKVVIPEYLSRAMANAVASEGAAYPDGPAPSIETPTNPLLVFINSKSGGRLGPELLRNLVELIHPNQVYDLAQTKPTTVLRYGIGCLDRMASSGDDCARVIRKNLRIIVAGGDGTVGWVLSTVGELQLLSPTEHIPPIGIIPLGTGNDMSRSFGWGGTFPSTAKSSLKKCLVKVMGASAAPLDTWQAVVMPAKSVAGKDIEFPHAMHPQHHMPLPTAVSGDNHKKDIADPAFEGLFFNYFSIGMDAQVAYGFHHLRDAKPWLARGRVANQMIYSGYGCTQGWFCTSCSMASRARGVGNILKLLIKRKGGIALDWEEVCIPSNIRAIVILNLQSYAGGRNPWGKPLSDTSQKEGFTPARCDDGLLEIMGLRDGWHTAFVMIDMLSAIRLCQAVEIRLELTGNQRRRCYLQMDGEPWRQPLGHPNEDPTVVVIRKLPEPSMLLKR